MRPVDKGNKTIDQYVGDGAKNAYEAFIDKQARTAAGTPKTLAFHQTQLTKVAFMGAAYVKHQGIITNIGLQVPLQRAANPFATWIYTQPAREDDYRDAKERLTAAIGEYCSFCERRIPAKLDVEHLAPKDVYPQRRLEWSNFLLACGNCNSIKLTKHKARVLHGGALWEETTPVTYCFWPDRLAPERNAAHAQDSFNVLQYGELGLLRPHPSIPNGQIRDRVLATIAIVGLDRILDDGVKPVPRLGFRNNADGGTAAAENWHDYELSDLAPSAGLMTNTGAAVTPALRVVVARDQSNIAAKYQLARRTGEVPSKDYRALHRAEAWAMAERYRATFDKLLIDNPKNQIDKDLQNIPLPDFKARVRAGTREIADLALQTGFWSVWVTVFKARGENAQFKRRPAIVPVLRRLITAFPGTRPNTDHNPLLYTAMEETLWAVEVRRKEVQHQRNEDQEFERQFRDQKEVLDLEDDVERLRDRVARRDRALDEEERRSRRYRHERDDALDDAARLREERDDARGDLRQAEGALYAGRNENTELRRRLEGTAMERDRAVAGARQMHQERDQAAAAAQQMRNERDQAAAAAQQLRHERDQVAAAAQQAAQQARAAVAQRDLALQQCAAEVQRLRNLLNPPQNPGW